MSQVASIFKQSLLKYLNGGRNKTEYRQVEFVHRFSTATFEQKSVHQRA